MTYELSTIKFINFKPIEENLDSDMLPIGTLLLGNSLNTQFALIDLFAFGDVALGL